MATSRTAATSSKSTTKPPTAPKPQAKAAPEAEATDGQTSSQSPGQIIAERYRDTAYETLVGRNGENVSAVMTAGEAMLAGMAEVSQEMMTFAGDRLRQDIETAEDFAKAQSPEELFDKQCSFAQRAAQQYVEHTSKMIGMFARIQRDCWTPVQERTRAALHDMNGANGSGANGAAEKD